MASHENPAEIQQLFLESQKQVGQLVRLVRTLIGVGVCGAAGALLLATARPGQSQTSPSPAAAATAHAAKPQSVLVVNAGNQSVPITGGVQAQQTGSWNVGINGTVQVASSGSNPVDANSSQGAYSTKIYVGSGVTPQVLAARTGGVSGSVGIGVTVGGYYEDAS